MSATMAAAFQIFAAAIVAGVAVPAVAYAFGVDRVLRHPLRHLEIVLASILARFPKPRKRVPGDRKYYRGRHVRKGAK